MSSANLEKRLKQLIEEYKVRREEFKHTSLGIPHYISYDRASVERSLQVKLTDKQYSEYVSILTSRKSLRRPLKDEHVPPLYDRATTLVAPSYRSASTALNLTRSKVGASIRGAKGKTVSDSQSGHVIGVNTFRTRNLIDALKEDNIVAGSSKGKELITKLETKYDALLKLDGLLEVKKDLSREELTGTVGLLISENAGANTSKGGKAGEIKRQIIATYSAIVKKHAADMATEMKGSPSYVDVVVKKIDEAAKGKKSKSVKLRSKANYNTSKKIKKSAAVVKDKSQPLRDKASGRFTSVLNVQNLINSALSEQVERNMRDPALNYETGRFAESVKLTYLARSRNNAVQGFYTYMKYPYQTFEVGYRQGSAARDPRPLIERSIREIAVGLISNKFMLERV